MRKGTKVDCHVYYRPETWTKVSNIIFMDSPIGSGFSYAVSDEGWKSSDTIAIKQLVIFLKKVTASISLMQKNSF
ncbi:hypothetical protein PR202_ga24530 [Eleusine coracana subsp. coracana]|uniref:Uncharacterized protein n=1 Tax=Eleusine coracana subsp. coracana TaxID=191504 RepID=A0AAV5D9B7_ELECO|nr:hypothetical protein PR202_ga24530 [Eleusine coracana subsp. coracana]